MLLPTTTRVSPFVLALAVALTGCDAQSQKAKADKAGKGDDVSVKAGDATVEADSSRTRIDDGHGNAVEVDEGGAAVKSADGSQVVVDENGNVQIRQVNGGTVSFGQ